MKYCLTKSGISGLINTQILNDSITDKELNKCIELAQSWDAQLLALNYLLGIVLLALKKRTPTEDVLNTLEETYKLENKLHLKLESLDEEFIQYLMQFESNPELESAEELRNFQEEFNNFQYDRKIRY